MELRGQLRWEPPFTGHAQLTAQTCIKRKIQYIIDPHSFRNYKLVLSNIHSHNPGLTISIGLKIFPVYLTVDSVQQRKRGMQNFKSDGIVQLGQSCVCGAAALFLHVWQVGELGCGGFALVPATVTAVAQSVYS